MSTPSVYRCYAGDTLLYVGFSANVPKRMAGHKSRSPWFTDMTRYTVTEYADHGQALEAEGDAIRAEKPLHNTMQRSPQSREASENAKADRLIATWTPEQREQVSDYFLALMDALLLPGGERPARPAFLPHEYPVIPVVRTYSVEPCEVAA